MIYFTFMLYFWKTHIYAEKVQLSDCLFRDSFIGLRLTLYSIYHRPLYICSIYRCICFMFYVYYPIYISILYNPYCILPYILF